MFQTQEEDRFGLFLRVSSSLVTATTATMRTNLSKCY